MKLNRFALFVSVFCGVVLGGVWSKPEKIADNAGSLLAIDNQGVCWCGGSAWIYKYHSETSDWQFETKALFGGRPFFDKGDTLWVYADELDANICYVRYDGENWSEKQYVPTYPSCNWGSEITIDSTGGLWAAWTTDWWYYWKVANNRYRNGQWGEPQPVPFIDTLEEIDYGLADITTDSYGRVWIATGKTTYDPRVLYLEASYYDGESWNEIMTIDVYEGYEAGLTNLTPDREGGMWVLFNHQEEHRGAIVILSQYWDGQAWSSPDTIAVSKSFYNDLFPGGKIVIDADGNAWAVWLQAVVEQDSCRDIYYSVNTGSGWSEPAPVDTHPAVDYYPDIAVDGEGRVWCVWLSTRDDEYGIWASYTWGVGVKEPVTPVTSVTQHLPSLTIDKSVGGEFTFSVSHSNIVRGIAIYDASGRVVRDLTISDNQTIHWDGTDANGQALSPGVYFVKLSPASSTLKLILIR